MANIFDEIKCALFKNYSGAEEIRNDTEKIKEEGDKWFTNIYIDDAKTQQLINEGKIKGVLSNKSVILVVDSFNLSKIYFFTVDFNDLTENLTKIIPCLKLPLSTEIYTDSRNKSQVEVLQNNLLKVGFKRHATQIRLSKVTSTNFYNDIDSDWYANENDCEEIFQMLAETFDFRCDQIPSVAELKEKTVRNEILVLKDKSKIISAIIFNRKPAVAEWVFWLTRPEARNSFSGLRLRDEYLKLTGNVRRQILYVREEKMKKFHEHFGFRVDGFENHIFVFDK